MHRLALHRRPRGMTLVEVLVALAIMAVLAAMAWRGTDAILRSREVTDAQLQRSLLVNTVIAQWERDLATLQETSAVPALTFDGASLRLTRQVPAGMQVVVWSMRSSTVLPAEAGKPPPQGGVLQRWAGPVVTRRAELQESWLASQQLQGVEPGHLRLLDGLNQWQIYFFRGSEWSNAQSSANRRPGTTFVPTRVELPTGVRLLLEFGSGSLREGALTRDVVLGPAS